MSTVDDISTQIDSQLGFMSQPVLKSFDNAIFCTGISVSGFFIDRNFGKMLDLVAINFMNEFKTYMS